MRKITLYLLALLLLLLFAVACGGDAEDASEPGLDDEAPLPAEPLPEEGALATLTAPPPVADDPLTPPEPDIEPGQEVEIREALINMVEVAIEPDPQRVLVTVSGDFRDGCSSLNEIEQMREGDTFVVTVTTQRPTDQLCTEALVPFEEIFTLDTGDAVPSGSYEVVVNGVSTTFEVPAGDEAGVADPAEQPVADDGVVPAACTPAGAEAFAFFNPDDGYCMQLPARFHVKDVFVAGTPGGEETGIAAVYGPPQDESLEPLQAGLSIEVEGAAGERSLQDIVDAELAEFPNTSPTVEAATLDSEPALVVEQLPGRSTNRQLFAIHNGDIYHLTLFPVGDNYEAVAGDVEALWTAVQENFAFLPGGFNEAFAACPQGSQELSPYLNPLRGFCFLYPSQFRLSREGDAVVLTSPIFGLAEPDAEPEQVILRIETLGEADGRALPEVFEDIGLEFMRGPDNETLIGGEEAVVVDTLLDPEVVGQTNVVRELYTVHDDVVYRLAAYPADDADLAEELEAVWETVLETFSWFKPIGGPAD